MLITILFIVFIIISITFYFKYLHLSQVPSQGKLIIVTGAAQGIGAQTTHELVRLGCIVIACDINESKLSNEFKGETKQVHTLEVDVRKQSDIQRIVEKVKELNLPVYGLVNNAGVGPSEACSLVDTPASEIERIAQINLLAPHHIIHSLYPYMIRLSDKEKTIQEQKQFIGSAIVNISSVMGEFTLPFSGYYAPSKAGLIGYSDQLRRELRFKKIRVSCIMPGPVQTTILDAR
jgi:short-subunit dehydrogenase